MTKAIRTCGFIAAFVLALSFGIYARNASSSPMPAVLKATDGPGFTINLTRNGTKVKQLNAGSYRFVVSDHSAIHNFALERKTGAQFSRQLTSVLFVGSKTVTVKLTKGVYEFYCTPHKSFMSGRFSVR